VLICLALLEAKIERVGFQKQRGVYLNKSFYLDKLRVSYFLFNGSCSLVRNKIMFLILTLFLDASLTDNELFSKFLREVSHAEKRAPFSDWWLH